MIDDPGPSPIPRRSVSVAEALGVVLAAMPNPMAVRMVARDAGGLVLAEPVAAREASPQFDTSAMDGYAVRAEGSASASPSAPITLAVGGTINAGHADRTPVAAGHAVRIMTGARVPDGANAVAPLESVIASESWLVLDRPVLEGQNIRRAGQEIREGDVILEAGMVLQSARIALLESQGIDAIRVFRRPRVSIFATGDELGAAPDASGGIRDSNSIMLASFCSELGAETNLVGRVPDSRTGLLGAISEATAGSDLIITTGGASVGDRDVVTELIRAGERLEALDVRMKPGRPLIVGTISGAPLIGLPGNPVAAYVSAMQFVRPAILTMRGMPPPFHDCVSARLAVDIPNPGQRTNFLRVRLEHRDGSMVATPSGPQGAANLRTLAFADGLLVIPEECELGQVDQVFDVQMLSRM